MSVFLRGALPIKEGVDFETLRCSMIDNFVTPLPFFKDLKAEENRGKFEYEDVRQLSNQYREKNSVVDAMVSFLNKLHVTHFALEGELEGTQNHIVFKQKFDMPLEYIKPVLTLLARRLKGDNVWALEYDEIGDNGNVLIIEENRIKTVRNSGTFPYINKSV